MTPARAATTSVLVRPLLAQRWSTRGFDAAPLSHQDPSGQRTGARHDPSDAGWACPSARPGRCAPATTSRRGWASRSTAGL